jgi:hypothetical protein
VGAEAGDAVFSEPLLDNHCDEDGRVVPVEKSHVGTGWVAETDCAPCVLLASSTSKRETGVGSHLCVVEAEVLHVITSCAPTFTLSSLIFCLFLFLYHIYKHT